MFETLLNENWFRNDWANIEVEMRCDFQVPLIRGAVLFDLQSNETISCTSFRNALHAPTNATEPCRRGGWSRDVLAHAFIGVNTALRIEGHKWRVIRRAKPSN
eukprot:66460-Amphidinium_carterae.1